MPAYLPSRLFPEINSVCQHSRQAGYNPDGKCPGYPELSLSCPFYTVRGGAGPRYEHSVRECGRVREADAACDDKDRQDSRAVLFDRMNSREIISS